MSKNKDLKTPKGYKGKIRVKLGKKELKMSKNKDLKTPKDNN